VKTENALPDRLYLPKNVVTTTTQRRRSADSHWYTEHGATGRTSRLPPVALPLTRITDDLTRERQAVQWRNAKETDSRFIMGQQGSKSRSHPRRTDFARDSSKMRLGSFKRGR